MLKLTVVLLIALSNLPKTTPCVAEWNQCGGINYAGETSCCGSGVCTVVNQWYFQCLPGPTTTTTQATGCASVYGQCGGQGWGGPTCCSSSVCVYSNPYYSQCLPDTPAPTTTPTTVTTTQSTTPTTTTPSTTTTTTPSTTTTTTPSTTTTASTSSSNTTQSSSCQPAYSQCGGQDWNGPTNCCGGTACFYINNWYHQCLPSGNPTSTPSPTASTASTSSTTQPGNDGRQSGVTTRYWDCCKASCGWSGKAAVTSPVRTCDRDGVTPVDPNAQSICTGGNASMCNNQQPWSVSDTLSYGYAAAHITGQGESQWCCACYSLLFTSGPVRDKEMIVQVTNTGGDLGSNHFDIQMPGGGVGIFDGWCSRQFPGSYSWGQRYGGVSSASDCANLPAVLQPGCYWRFNWFQNADNPSMRFKQVPCPSALTANTQCVRL